MSVEIKQAVTVSEMARMVGLSRARFYQLIGSAFPFPVYNVSTKRPFFDESLQTICLEVRRRNCGIDGKGRWNLIVANFATHSLCSQKTRGLLDYRSSSMDDF